MIKESNIESEIKKFVLQNAISHKGKCNPGAIIGKIIGIDPDLKKDMKSLSQKIQNIAKEINSLNLEAQKQELIKIIPDYFEKQKELKEKRQEERKDLPPLKNAEDGKVITRISPEPSKYNHIGHAISFLINYIYKIKYNGKCILRFEDTNPEKESQEYVDAMQEDVLNYLDIKTDETVFVSDHMEKYYEMAEQLIKESHAYTCKCESKNISLNRREMKECDCRNKPINKIKEEWESMKKGEPEEGSITLRLKIDMSHKNAVMRDPVIFRLCYSSHYRQGDKYKVWPMYDFENAIEEGLSNITHVLRSNEFDSRIELQNYIRNLFNLKNPEVKQYARFEITGTITKGREIRQLIESGDYIGWDDPRLVTLRALKRRGIVKEAYYELAKVIGMSKTNSNLDFSVIASINRKILDEKAFRYFFIKDPIEITIEKAPEQSIELDLHPNKKGGRPFKTNENFFISKEDYNLIKDGETIRLMDCLNFKKEKNKFIFTGTDYNSFKGKIIHWLPKNENITAKILMPDNTLLEGLCESNIKNFKEEIVQFERFCFCRLDDRKNFLFWFTHK